MLLCNSTCPPCLSMFVFRAEPLPGLTTRISVTTEPLFRVTHPYTRLYTRFANSGSPRVGNGDGQEDKTDTAVCLRVFARVLYYYCWLPTRGATSIVSLLYMQEDRDCM